MSDRDLHHQLANEVGVALGMIQLAGQRLSLTQEMDAALKLSLKNYLDKAESALSKMKDTIKAMREEARDPSRP